MSDLRTLLRQARQTLAAAGIPDPVLDARLLVEHGAGVSREDVLLQADLPVAPDAAEAVRALVRRRSEGEPAHRIIGWREFYGLRLKLSPATLEPRPDTETLVEAVLPFVRRTADGAGLCRILDLGTGTGAVALALLSQEPRAIATGVDLSDQALETAADNARTLGLGSRFRTLRSDWFGAVVDRHHWIVTNPPYISAHEMMALPTDVARFDPELALFGGPDGLDAYRAIAQGASNGLEPGGGVAVEIGAAQKHPVESIFAVHGFELLCAAKDLGGRDRALVFGQGARSGLA